MRLFLTITLSAVIAGFCGVVIGVVYSKNQPRNYLHPGLQWRFSEAASRGDVNELKKLLQSGAQVNGEPFDGTFSGFPALICAASGGHSQAVAWLLENGADANLSPNDTPLSAAIYRLKDTERTIETLKSHGGK